MKSPVVINTRFILEELDDIQRDVLPGTAVDGFLLQIIWSIQKHRTKPIKVRPGVLDGFNAAIAICTDARIRSRLQGLLSAIERLPFSRTPAPSRPGGALPRIRT